MFGAYVAIPPPPIGSAQNPERGRIQGLGLCRIEVLGMFRMLDADAVVDDDDDDDHVGDDDDDRDHEADEDYSADNDDDDGDDDNDREDEQRSAT